MSKAALSGKYAAYPEYKDSGVEWLGEIPGHWQSTTIKYGYDVTLGKMLQKAPKSGADTYRKYLKAQNIQPNGIDISKVDSMWFSNEELKKLRLQCNDVLVSEGGDVGRSAIWKDQLSECYIQNAINRIRPKKGNSPFYFYYWMCSLKASDYINIICNKATIAHYTAEKVEVTPLLLPPIKEQTQIAAFLDHETAKIDTLIEKQQQLIELLKEKRQAVISHAVTKGLNPDAPMKDSGVEWLGEVPEHWGVYKLKHACSEIFLGLTSKVDYVDFGGIPLVRALNINGGILDLTQARHISEAQHKKLTTYRKAARNDVLLSKSGTIGTAAIVDTDIEFSIYESIFALRAIKEILHPKYLLFFIQSSVAKSQYSKGSVGMGVHHLNMPDIEEVLIPIPSLNMQELILNKLNVDMLHFEQLVDNAKKSIKLMQERRTALISAAVTGKIDVRNWVAPTTSSDTTEKLSATV